MGGGGGGRGFTPYQISQLETAARATFRTADQPSRHNAYISFAHEDLTAVNLLRGQAKNDQSDLEFIDRSLHKPFDSEDAEYIKRGIRERIRQASVTVVYLTDHTSDSQWVDWEVRESVRQGKGVIAVHPGERPPARLPPVIREFNVPIHRWSAKDITEAIDRAAGARQPPSDQ